MSLYIKLLNGEEFLFSSEEFLSVCTENSCIIVTACHDVKSVCVHSKYFFTLKSISIFQVKE